MKDERLPSEFQFKVQKYGLVSVLGNLFDWKTLILPPFFFVLPNNSD